MTALLVLTAIFGLMASLMFWRASRNAEAPVQYGNPLPGTVGVLVYWVMGMAFVVATAACGIGSLVTYLAR